VWIRDWSRRLVSASLRVQMAPDGTFVPDGGSASSPDGLLARQRASFGSLAPSDLRKQLSVEREVVTHLREKIAKLKHDSAAMKVRVSRVCRASDSASLLRCGSSSSQLVV
jgi:hypothetical protein